MASNKSGGTRTKADDIEVDKEFYVCNGCWEGVIGRYPDGSKYLQVLSLPGEPKSPLDLKSTWNIYYL